MPGSRKRKRAENIEPTASPTPSSSRRRGRDSTPGAEPAKNKKHENSKSGYPATITTTNDTGGESITSSSAQGLTKTLIPEGSDHAEEYVISSQTKSLVEQNNTAVQEKNTAEDQINTDPISQKLRSGRKEEIQTLLQHRNILIKRVRQGRLAAQRRLDKISDSDPAKKIESFEQEVAVHRELHKSVASAAKKVQRNDAEVIEKRLSFSLRKGASVGKRMNAALSTLAPGHGHATAPSISSSATTSTLPKVSTEPSNGNASLAQPNPPVEKIVPAASNANASIAITIPSQPPERPISSIHSTLPVKKEPLKKEPFIPTQGRPIVHKGPKSSGAVRSALQHAANISGDHHHTSISGMVQTVNQRPVRPVVCRETAVLREKKIALARRLELLLTDRLKRQKRQILQFKEKSVTQNPPKNFHLGAPMTTVSTELPQKAIKTALAGPGEQCCIPARRRTHWDVVLDEMKWLATDFIEERKWKIAAAMTVGNSLQVRDLQKSNLMSLSPAKSVEKKESIATSKKVSIINKGRIESAGNIEITLVGDRLYSEPSENDRMFSRKVAADLTQMVCDKAATLENSTRNIDYSLSTQLYGTGSSANMNTHVVDSIILENGDNHLLNNTEDLIKFQHNGFESALRKVEAEKEFAQFSKFIESKLRRNENLEKPVLSKNTDLLPIPLTLNQRNMLETMLNVASSVKAGTIVGGPVSSGKTIVVCSFLWKHRSDGTQLVICSSASMVRWMHEIGRFESLRSRPIISGSSIPNDFTAGDVALCNYHEITKIDAKIIASFCTIVVDSRFSKGFYGSRFPKTSNKSLYVTALPHDIDVSQELINSMWWYRLASLNFDCNQNRIIVDDLKPELFTHFHACLPDRQLLDLLGMRFAFIVGGNECMSSSFLLMPKSFLAWARRRIKNSSNHGTKFERVRDLILNLIASFYYEFDDVFYLQNITSQPTQMSWFLSYSKMTSSQRLVYENYLRESQTILSTYLEPRGQDRTQFINHISAVSDILLELRRIFIHANCKAILSKLVNTASFNKGPSQTDTELASQIISGSGKLRELAFFFINELDAEVANFLYTDIASESFKTYPKYIHNSKVAIVASLPEAQFLTSCLLTSLGIDHELLVSLDSVKSSKFASNNEFPRFHQWVTTQLALSRFNQSNQPTQKLNIVIASPDVFGGDHNGLGVETADVIICLDEDWSGRSELIMRSLQLRCYTNRGKLEAGCTRFIKLKTFDTIEYQGAVQSSQLEKEIGQVLNAWAECPASACGFFDLSNIHLSESFGKTMALDHYPSFARCSFLGLRNQRFTDVFSLSKFDHRPFASDAKFLPCANDDFNELVNLGLISCLITNEESATRVLQVEYERHVLTLRVQNLTGRLHVECHKILAEQMSLISNSAHSFLFKTTKENTNTVEIGSLGILPSAPSVETFVPIADSMQKDILVDTEEKLDEIVIQENSKKSLDAELFYEASTPCITNSCKFINEKTKDLWNSCDNIYACAYSQVAWAPSNDDGNSGVEALVLFPPLIPQLLQTFSIASRDIQNIRSIKKGRYDVTTTRTDFENSKQQILCFNSDDKKSQSDAASDLLAFDYDYGLLGVGAVPLPRTSALAAFAIKTENSGAIFEYNESRNRFTRGMACDEEERNVLYMDVLKEEKMVLFVSRKRPRVTAPPALAYQEITSGLWAENTLQSPLPTGRFNEVFTNVNGGKKVKKKNFIQKGPNLGGSAFNSLSEHAGIVPQKPIEMKLQNSKDNFHNRASIALKQRGLGNVLFEEYHYRVSMARVRGRVLNAVSCLSWNSNKALDAGLGPPFIACKEQGSATIFDGHSHTESFSWTSIAKRLKSRLSITGDEAFENANDQRASFRQSLDSPCRVDFGPFTCGYLFPTFGMTSISMPKSRVGVSLPLGVKLQIPKELSDLSWMKDVDETIQQAVKRFGLNWILIAKIVRGIQENVHHPPNKVENQRHLSISARSCRDRWQSLLRTQPMLIEGAKTSLHAHQKSTNTQEQQITEISKHRKEMPVTSLEELGRCEATQVSIDSTANSKTVSTSPINNSNDNPSREAAENAVLSKQSKDLKSASFLHPFAAFRAAKAKTFAPPPTPGIVIGRTPTVSPSHQSHMQAVQASVAASWNSGKTEMWPLQLLDAASKQRAAKPGTNAAPSTSQIKVSALNVSSAVASNSRLTSGSSQMPSTQRLPSDHTISKTTSKSNTNASYPQAPTNTIAPSSGSLCQQQSRSSSSSIQSFIPPSKSPAVFTEQHVQLPPAPETALPAAVVESQSPDNQQISQKNSNNSLPKSPTPPSSSPKS